MTMGVGSSVRDTNGCGPAENTGFNHVPIAQHPSIDNIFVAVEKRRQKLIVIVKLFSGNIVAGNIDSAVEFFFSITVRFRNGVAVLDRAFSQFPPTGEIIGSVKFKNIDKKAVEIWGDQANDTRGLTTDIVSGNQFCFQPKIADPRVARLPHIPRFPYLCQEYLQETHGKFVLTG